MLHLVSVCQLFYGLPNSLHGVFGLSGIDPKLVKQIAGVDSGQSLTFALPKSHRHPAIKIFFQAPSTEGGWSWKHRSIAFNHFCIILISDQSTRDAAFDEIFRFDLVSEDCVILLAAHLAVGSYSRNAESMTVYDESLGGLSDRLKASSLEPMWLELDLLACHSLRSLGFISISKMHAYCRR